MAKKIAIIGAVPGVAQSGFPLYLLIQSFIKVVQTTALCQVVSCRLHCPSKAILPS